jgi:hypothetical protein
MMKQGFGFWLLIALSVVGFSACQRETQAEKVGSYRPNRLKRVEQAVQQTVEGIKGPMEGARSVEDTYEKSTERMPDQVQGAMS